MKTGFLLMNGSNGRFGIADPAFGKANIMSRYKEIGFARTQSGRRSGARVRKESLADIMMVAGCHGAFGWRWENPNRLLFDCVKAHISCDFCPFVIIYRAS